MGKPKYKKKLKLSDDLKVGDEFKLGGNLVKIEAIRVNDYDQLVFDLEIIGARFKKYSKAMLIHPRKTPITILQ